MEAMHDLFTHGVFLPDDAHADLPNDLPNAFGENLHLLMVVPEKETIKYDLTLHFALVQIYLSLLKRPIVFLEIERNH